MTSTRKIAGFVLAVLLVVISGAAAPAFGDSHENAFVGSKACKKCHLKQSRSWAETTMAQTYEALKPGERAEAKVSAGLDPDKDYTGDAECLACHVTGLGKPGGFVDIETTPELAGVGCEACHGAGEKYIEKPIKSADASAYVRAPAVEAGLIPQPSADQCTVCHNADSPFQEEGFVFDFEANKDKGIHEHFPLKSQQ